MKDMYEINLWLFTAMTLHKSREPGIEQKDPVQML